MFGFGGGSLCGFMVGVIFGCEEGSGPLVIRPTSLGFVVLFIVLLDGV